MVSTSIALNTLMKVHLPRREKCYGNANYPSKNQCHGSNIIPDGLSCAGFQYADPVDFKGLTPVLTDRRDVVFTCRTVG